MKRYITYVDIYKTTWSYYDNLPKIITSFMFFTRLISTFYVNKY